MAIIISNFVIFTYGLRFFIHSFSYRSGSSTSAIDGHLLQWECFRLHCQIGPCEGCEEDWPAQKDHRCLGFPTRKDDDEVVSGHLPTARLHKHSSCCWCIFGCCTSFGLECQPSTYHPIPSDPRDPRCV